MPLAAEKAIDPGSRQFYVDALTKLIEANIEFLVGGAYAFERYTGIARHTKDFDIFLTREGTEQAMTILAGAGYEVEMTFPHWLAKAHNGSDFIDLIFGAGNGVAIVDELWFEHAVGGEVLGVPVKLMPAEEMIWSKAFVMERERFDGADVAHLLRQKGRELDWGRLLRRFAPYPRVLLAHVILFGFIYPDAREEVPPWVTTRLFEHVQDQGKRQAPREKVCYGTMLSRSQFLVDIGRWGYQDGRLLPPGTMTAEDIAYWTAVIEGEKST